MSKFYDWFKAALFPPRCILCGCFLRDVEKHLCSVCTCCGSEYPYGASNPPPKGKNNLHFLDSVTAIWYYEDNVRRSIHRFKFRRAYHLAPKFGSLLASVIRERGPEGYDVITWVPVSRIRRFSRGYDQCRMLAQFTARELGKEPKSLLVKSRNTPPQSGIHTDAERKANVLGAFRIAKGAYVAGKRILLLDDIYTTGATTEECAKVLLLAGAKEVHCAVLAAVRSRK